MDVLILTTVRLFGEALERCLSTPSEISVVNVVHDFAALRDSLARLPVDLVLIDITQGIDFDEVRALAAECPGATLLALGLKEQGREVVQCGRAGFAGYVPRDASVDALKKCMRDAVDGRLRCPDEIAGSLLRALCRDVASTHRSPAAGDSVAEDCALSPREGDVARLISHGFSNKEIARELNLSIATVKHHVHSILEKLRLVRRAQVMRRVREEPWLAELAGAARGRRLRRAGSS